jgi:hypothetical protein
VLAELRAGQQQVLEELRALRAELREHRPRRQPPGAEALLHEMRRHVGDRAFTARELVEFAALPDSEALRIAITALTQGALNPKRLGKLLRRVEGLPVEGFVLRAIGADSAGRIWGFETLSNQFARPAQSERGA